MEDDSKLLVRTMTFKTATAFCLCSQGELQDSTNRDGTCWPPQLILGARGDHENMPHQDFRTSWNFRRMQEENLSLLLPESQGEE